MTTYYVGIGGNDANNGTTWALRKLTLNGAEDIPVAAGDTVYVGPGVYREQLTCDVSGGAGTPIIYIGDVSGEHTDGVGGIVRVTGSDNDTTLTRARCFSLEAKNYRTFQGFTCDGTTAYGIYTTGTNLIVQDCTFQWTAGPQIATYNASQAGHTIQRCFFMGSSGITAIRFNNNAAVDNCGHLVSNCIFIGGYVGVSSDGIGGITVKNCLFDGRIQRGIQVFVALTVGQTIGVNNCIFYGVGTCALTGTVAGEIVEDYNSFCVNNQDRDKTNTGAHSNAYPALFDQRWFFELISGKGRMVSPFDLASFSQLVNLAGTSPAATDMRGTGTIGAQREWGALEYDPTLLIRRVIGRNA